jgi:hypothetical protein
MKIKLVIILVLGLIHTGCGQQSSEKDNVKVQETEINPNEIFNEIVDLHHNLISNDIKKKYQIKFSFKPTIDSLRLADIKNRISLSPNRFSKGEEELLQKLINQKNQNISFTSKETNKSDTTLNNIYEIQFSKFILYSTSAASLVATYFRKPNSSMISGGWEEIVIYQKEGDRWTIEKKEMIVEY